MPLVAIDVAILLTADISGEAITLSASLPSGESQGLRRGCCSGVSYSCLVPPARPAATVVLLRQETRDVEVFLVRRHGAIAFMGGAYVFPGGRVDPADHLSDPEAICDGVEAARARLSDVPAEEAIAAHVAAVRELFEEAGVLLARGVTGGIVAIDGPDEPRFLDYRRQLAAGTLTMRGVAECEHLRLALDELAFFAHWVTPEVEPRRFDTRFFAAVAPEAQQASHDDGETTHGVWLTPSQAIERCRRGEITLPPPTWTTLRALEHFADLEIAIQWARTQTAPRIQPGYLERDGARYVALPGDPTVPPIEGFTARETRFSLEHGRWKPVEVDED